MFSVKFLWLLDEWYGYLEETILEETCAKLPELSFCLKELCW